MRCVSVEGDTSEGRLSRREKGEEEQECGSRMHEKMVVRLPERPAPRGRSGFGEGHRVR